MNECTECTPARVTTTRRRFMIGLIAVVSSLLGVIVGLPFIDALLGSRFRSAKEKWIRVTELQTIPEGTPVRLNFVMSQQDAYVQQTSVHSVWIVRQSPAAVTAFSPVCPHAGCYYNWDGRLGNFACPCHGSVFRINGPVVSGPAPRPLDALPVKIENGAVYVTWKRFKAGVPEKIEI